ncbi:MAG: endoglycosylceramidase [Thermoleophilaceae bacterium]|nr:endoglycosylceramidase [Thermoleophilaceae bacterium]
MLRPLAVLLLALVIAAPAAAKVHGPLGHQGRWITDRGGRVVTLRGINMVYKLSPYAPDAVGFGDDDAAFLASEGFTTVRLGVIYEAVEPSPGAYDDAYLGRIAATVRTLARHGIFTLLDFHQDLFSERFQGEGFPNWAIQDDGLPAQPQSGFPGNYLLMPALQHSFDHFWANDPGPGGVGLQDRYAAAWRHVAERFGRNRHVLGYDLFNEPWPGTTWQQCANPAGCPVFDAQLSAFNARAIAAIRTVDPDTLVFYEPQVFFNNGARPGMADTGDANTAMSFHDYCVTAGEGGGGYAGCETVDDMVFQNADDHAASVGDALLLTEFGATDQPDVLEGVLGLADRHMVGWQEWHYCGCGDPTTTGSGDKQAIVLDPAKPPAGDNLKKPTVDLLARPYPRAVAGTPKGWAFDAASRRFELTYTRRRASGHGSFRRRAATEVVVPKRRYRHGYKATVTGGKRVSRRGARVLRIHARKRARRVKVTIVPRPR